MFLAGLPPCDGVTRDVLRSFLARGVPTMVLFFLGVRKHCMGLDAWEIVLEFVFKFLKRFSFRFAVTFSPVGRFLL